MLDINVIKRCRIFGFDPLLLFNFLRDESRLEKIEKTEIVCDKFYLLIFQQLVKSYRHT